MSRNNIIDDEDLKLLNALVDPSSVASNSITVLNEEFDVLTPENARFVSGQDLYLYIPKVQTNKRYGLAKFNATDFSISNKGVVSLLYSKSQIEDYFTEVRGGSREETVIANPSINLLNLDKTDKLLKSEINDLYSKDSEIYGSSGREGTVLNGIDLTKLNERDNTLQKNIDFIIQDDRVNTSIDSTYSAKKITELIKDAKMEGLHFVGFIGSELGKDYNGESETKDGILWLVSDTTDKPNKDMFKDAEVYILNGETWEPYTEYEQSNFDIWKNVNIDDENINTWWYFEGVYEVLDFGVDMNLYYTKIESDARFKSIFTYGDYLSEVNSVLTIDNLVMPTTGKLSSFIKGDSKLESTNVEDAIKELELYSQGELDKINARPFWLNFMDEPTREGEYSVTTNGVYRSYQTEDGFEWRLVTTDLDSLLPRVNAHRDVANGLDFYVDSETGYLLSTLKLINLNTENESSTPVSVPVATLSNDGIMPATAMRGISELELRVNALESGTKSYFVDFGSDTPTQTVLDILYQTASGDTDTPPDLTRLIDIDRNMYFEYYSELEVHWQGAYTYRYGIAEIDVPGLVTASEQKGQIFVEPVTGKMSLNGYTDIINTFNTLYGGESRSSIAVSQVPELPATKITSGTLNSARLPIVPISKGGTNSESFSAYKLVITGDVDETDSTANKLMDGPSFGALNTVLVGKGANQVPEFVSVDDLVMNNYLPLSAGSNHILTGNLYSQKDILLYNNAWYTSKGTNGVVKRVIGISTDDNIYVNFNFGINTIIGGDAILPLDTTEDIGSSDTPFNLIYAKNLYKNNYEVLNLLDKEELQYRITTKPCVYRGHCAGIASGGYPVYQFKSNYSDDTVDNEGHNAPDGIDELRVGDELYVTMSYASDADYQMSLPYIEMKDGTRVMCQITRQVVTMNEDGTFSKSTTSGALPSGLWKKGDTVRLRYYNYYNDPKLGNPTLYLIGVEGQGMGRFVQRNYEIYPDVLQYYMKLAGDDTISGTKTFIGNVIVPDVTIVQ